MNKTAWKCLGLLLVGVIQGSITAQASALIDPALKNFARAQKGSKAEVLVLMKTVEEVNHPQRYNRPEVIRYFKESTTRSIAPLMQMLQGRKLGGVKIKRTFWLNRSLLAEVTPRGLVNLANLDSVAKIYLNGKSDSEPVIVSQVKAADATNPIEYNLKSIGIDKLYAEQPQVNGQGMMVGVVDTGVDGSHEALKDKIKLFYNGTTHALSEPTDFDVHGTHVSGTIAGGDRQTNWIGVAPAASLVEAGVVDQGFDQMLEGMQWMIDVENNPAVANQMKAVSCSWNTEGAPDQEVFYKAIAAWEATGILPVFSAGNAGQAGITHPHEHPAVFAVAAYQEDGTIASFSSRGPGHFNGQETKKPDIAAPGVNVLSSLPNGQYGRLDGTSMATPHVTGTVALLLQVNPKLNPVQLREILMKTATPPTGANPGDWGPEFGYGKLNSYEAVKLAESTNEVPVQMVGDMFVFKTPAEIGIQALQQDTLGEVDGPLDQFGPTNESKWLKVSDL